MKAFIVLTALLAVAAAEADPALVYSTLGYNYGTPLAYNAWNNAPLSYNLAAAPVAYSAAVAPVAAPITYAAAPVAAPITYTAAPVAAPVVYAAKSCTNVNGEAVPCAHGVAKREAEAEADPALVYSTLGYNYGAPIAAGWPYTAYHAAVAAPVTYTTAATAPVAYTTAATAPVAYTSTYTTPLTYSYTSAHLIGKREAEAEADPALVYSTLGYNYGAPLAYNAWNNAPLVYNNFAATPLAYNWVASPLVKAIHPSTVGICLNNQGAQVPC